MAKQCKGKTKSGQPCRMKPIGGGDFCFTHNPATRASQAEARKLGGFNRHTPHAGDLAIIPAEIRTIADAAKILSYVMAELLAMDNGIQRARALIALFDSFAKSIEIGELEARIAALEARAGR
jgi:hypothetical protein